MQKVVRPERESEFWFEDKIVNRQGGKKHREHSWADASDPGAQDDGGKEKRRAKRVAPERKRDGQSNGDGYNRQRVMTNSMLEDAMRRALLGKKRSLRGQRCELECCAKIIDRSLEMVQLSLKLAEHGVQQIIRTQLFAVLNGFDRFNTGCRPVNVRHCNGAIERNDRRIVE